ncbi:cupin-like domain-containing protein [Microbulbifer sp. CAU 1566]|uniref:cupin-like domain-containing protein n=1 Tax=Microbulbifer sp. CAU 1566 TaxID=2933269 RepID=UPI0020038609|nr:cupin-like domain-containing protein [Microbulbifer sp. CAU 1566]MCK7598640.1 cupin-like domain-containing protein [Microbulbifer sp. CAU 1566]
MIEIKNKVPVKVPVIDGSDLTQLPLQQLLDADKPVVMKGFARNWPLVQAGLESPQAAMRYLEQFYNGSPLVAYIGAPEIDGQFGYSADFSGLNFSSERISLSDFLQHVENNLDEDAPPSFYIGSTTVDACLPGFRAGNDLLSRCESLARFAPLASIWLGNRTLARAHFDKSHNIACSLVGRRRFTLFPPDQVANLYPGPLELSPGGQVVSMVDFRNPDYTRYPNFAEALKVAQVADLEPGDVLFYPALWWHQVEALAPFNVMMNYWWNPSPAFMDTPMHTLLHGILSLRDRPQSEKLAWRALFEYYLFGDAELPRAHLPEHARGALEELDTLSARRLRAQLLQRLNR